VAMVDRPLADRLDETVDAVVARDDATAALSDPELAPLALVAADLRHCPSSEFRAKLRAQLERRTNMTAVSTTIVGPPSRSTLRRIAGRCSFVRKPALRLLDPAS
jgi:hypothetical protein